MSILNQVLSRFATGTQTVYRFSSQEEVNAFENKDLSSLGENWERNKFRNSHKYKDDEKYLHFFETPDIPSRIIGALPGEKTHICSFEIEKSLLIKYRGNGYYPPRGYEENATIIQEYALPISEIDPNCFIEATPLEQQNALVLSKFEQQLPPES